VKARKHNDNSVRLTTNTLKERTMLHCNVARISLVFSSKSKVCSLKVGSSPAKKLCGMPACIRKSRIPECRNVAEWATWPPQEISEGYKLEVEKVWFWRAKITCTKGKDLVFVRTLPELHAQRLLTFLISTTRVK
jgi:hypothetical protein